MTNEAAVLLSLQRASRPDWIIEARAATEKEDHKRIDIVIETTDRGTLYLQVKSSERGAEKFREQGDGGRPIGLVIVQRDDDLNTIYGRSLGALILLRERPGLFRAGTT